jgi:predicted GIY-YIG superfamily endonuclease
MPKNFHIKTATDEELRACAKKYVSIKQWKDNDPVLYRICYGHRSKEFYRELTAHMLMEINPDNLPYTVYAVEFADNHVYIGYTYQPSVRKYAHQNDPRSSAFQYLNICPTSTFKILEDGIKGVAVAAQQEVKFEQLYLSLGWQLVNKAPCGGISGSRINERRCAARVLS